MPITINQIKALQRFSNSNFRKFECEYCGGEFYSVRQSKYCSSACKQSAYRLRLQNKEDKPIEITKETRIEGTIEQKIEIESEDDSKITLEVNEKIKQYELKIESLNK